MSQRRRKRRLSKNRKAAVMVLMVILLPFLLAYSAFSIDLGYIIVTQSQLQSSADAAALAAANHVIDMRAEFHEANPSFFQDTNGDGNYDTWGTLPSDFYLPARNTAQAYTQANPAGGVAIDIDLNASNDASGDLVFGTYQGDDMDLDTSDPVLYNSVRVLCRRDTTYNGEISLFFGRLANWNTQSLQARAQATFAASVSGIEAPPDGQNSTLMPFALSEDAWNRLRDLWLAGVSDDNFAYDPDGSGNGVTGGIADDGGTPVSDGIPEINMFPGGGQTSSDTTITQGVGQISITPGNFGTVEIGGGSSSTARLVNQVLNGPTQAEFDYHGGSFNFSNNRTMNVNADPGISAGMADAMESIVGETRSIFLYDRVGGRGATTVYRLTRIVSIRVMSVKLSGGTKVIWVQPGNATDPGAMDGGSPDWTLAGPPALTL